MAGRWPRGVRMLALCCMSAALAGCPPTGEPPPFDPQLPDLDGGFDVSPGDAASDGRVIDATDVRPDAVPDDGVDAGPPPGCVDRDDDGFVEQAGCALPPGDCAPDDPERGPGATERCNGIDDDCDSAADEGEPEAGQACETGAPGLCAAGVTTCEDGALDCIAQNRPAPVERCDGVDDDCDGAVDEDDPDSGAICVVEGLIGACAAGVEACRNGALRCVPTGPPGPETCNGLDDDCDGETDEGDPGAGAACETELSGICRIGTTFCGGGEGIGCSADNEPGPERCNGQDDDCDGQVDETFDTLGEICRVGQGICRRDSVWACNAEGDGVECDAEAGDGRPERCNEADDDCDGVVDEGFGVGAPCESGLGACAAPGVVLCAADGRTARCRAQVGEPRDELCDGIDDDCDGAVDELYPVGLPCEAVVGLCRSRGTLVCDANNQSTTCEAPPVMPTDEVCNGIDDDCDDTVDEGFAGLGEVCADGVGACRREGLRACSADGMSVDCGVEPGAPRDELCNGIDDDCDGRIDNRAPCQGPPAAVVTLRFARVDDPACGDLDGDGEVDNALGVLSGRFAGELAEAFAAERRVMLLRIADLDQPGPHRVELVEARPAPGGPRPLLRSLTPEGRARDVVGGVEAAPGYVLSTPDPAGEARMPSPLFYDRDPRFEALTGLRLRDPAVVGGPVEPVDAAGLRIAGLRLIGTVDRAAALDDYAAAEARCAEAGATAPAGCAIFDAVDTTRLDGLLRADLDLDPTPGGDALSACFIVEGFALPDGASVPVGGGPCTADSDCFANHACRPMPTVSDPDDGAALVERCGVPGAGLEPFGVACAGDDDCLDALCVTATAAGGQCSALCDDDAGCPLGQVCRGVARDVEGARTTGGASASVCVQVQGSGETCGVDSDCPQDEVCGVWLTGAGTPGAAQTEGRCQIADDLGAPPGAPCAGPADCARGNNCLPGLDDQTVCAAPCDGAGRCAEGDICVDRVLVAGVGDDPDVVNGFCLPVPAALGSGTRCEADVHCLVGETCAARVLESADAVERFCAVGVGFGTVGQPCIAGDRCASGRCAGGLCSGACGDDGDCGPALGCVADAMVVDGRPVGGACLPASADCGEDADCVADGACADGRCVCAGGSCRIGCRFPGVCPGDGDRCHPDGTCAPFCRDDADEPDDDRGSAILLPVSPRAPVHIARRQLCSNSPVDWLRVDNAGQPVRVRLEHAPVASVLTVDLFAPNGALLAAGQALEPLDAVVAESPGPTPGPLFVRVRAAGLGGSVDYQLRVELLGEACVDPTEPVADDAPVGGVELVSAPGRRVADEVEGVVCTGDVDWHPVWLDGLDQLTLEMAVEDAVGDGVQLEIWGPDAPGMPGSAVRGALPAGGGGRVDVFAGRMDCPANGDVCTYDGQETAIPCERDQDCFGAPFFVRLRGRTASDGGTYRLSTTMQRALGRACVPDPREPDDAVMTLERLANILPAGAVRAEPEGLALTPDRDVVLSGRRACTLGVSTRAADLDLVPTRARTGDRLVADLRRPDPVEGPIAVRFLRWQDDGWVLLGEVPVAVAEGRVGQDIDEDGLYAVAIARPEELVDPIAPYDLTLRRETAASDDAGCADAEPVDLGGGAPVVIDTTTTGRADTFSPLRCVGGGGPDRVFAVTGPPGGGTLDVVAEALEAGVDPALSARADCEAVISELTCAEDDPLAADPLAATRIAVPIADGETVFVIVDSFDPDSAGEVRVTFSLQ